MEQTAYNLIRNRIEQESENPFLRNCQHAIKMADTYKNINVVDASGTSLLFEAVKYDNVEFVQYLIKRGINVNIKNQNGDNALVYLGNCSNPEYFLDVLIEAGIDINNLSDTRCKRCTILDYFIMWPKPKAAIALIKRGIIRQQESSLYALERMEEYSKNPRAPKEDVEGLQKIITFFKSRSFPKFCYCC